MRKAIKIQGSIVTAYELGQVPSCIERELILSGKIHVLPNGKYEIFSREARNGTGEIASTGDFIKIDNGGFPYPNDRKFFLTNHKHISEHQYEQIPKLVEAWTAADGSCPEIEFLIKNKGLVIDPNNRDQYFTAPLWGTFESAAYDAVIVFYEIQRDSIGNVKDAVFNFVEKSEFQQTYEWLEHDISQ